MSSKVEAKITRDGPITKIAEFYVRGCRYSLNVNYLKTEEEQQWFLNVVSGILRDVDTQAAEAVQHGMQSKLRELLGLEDKRNVFAEPVYVTKAALKL